MQEGTSSQSQTQSPPHQTIKAGLRKAIRVFWKTAAVMWAPGFIATSSEGLNCCAEPHMGPPGDGSHIGVGDP